jgi:hypothetical protein
MASERGEAAISEQAIISWLLGSHPYLRHRGQCRGARDALIRKEAL